MPRLALAALVASLAAAAGLGGTYVRDWIDPKPAYAQAKPGVKIALLNLEAVSRGSPRFRELKQKWDEIQRELAQERQRSEQAYASKTREVQVARREKRSEEELVPLEIEMQTLRDAVSELRKQQAQYIELLLAQYQADVLASVMMVVKEYADYHEYDLVLQDYTPDEPGDGFFGGAAFAHTVINKPVLYAPDGNRSGTKHVTDISADLQSWVAGNRPPPKKD